MDKKMCGGSIILLNSVYYGVKNEVEHKEVVIEI